MIQHEHNDPREPQRQRDERARQNRLTRYLVLAIGVLLGLIAVALIRSFA
jgi:nitrate reductase NapE component